MCLNDLKILSEWFIHKLDWIGSQFLLTDSMIHSQWAAGILSVNNIVLLWNCNCSKIILNYIALFVTQSSCMTSEDGWLFWRIYKLFETWKIQSTFMHGKEQLALENFSFCVHDVCKCSKHFKRLTISFHRFSLKISTENGKTSADPIWGY